MGRVIEASGVTHRYPGGHASVRQVDLSVAAGESVVVVGPNGSGKSALHQLLGGLVEPDAGTVRYFEETTDAETVRERLGVLLQDPDDTLFNPTVREDVLYGPAQFGVPRGRAEERTAELADRLGLDGLLDRPPYRLSGGERQRAALAAVLSYDPEVLLLDEPLSAVDATYRERVLELLSERDGAAVVFTPDLTLAPHLGERAVLLGRDGRVVADDDMRQVLGDPALLREHGLSPPPIVQLFADDDRPPSETPLTVAEGRRRLDAD